MSPIPVVITAPDLEYRLLLPVLLIFVGANVLEYYGWGLFVGMPFVLGHAFYIKAIHGGPNTIQLRCTRVPCCSAGGCCRRRMSTPPPQYLPQTLQYLHRTGLPFALEWEYRDASRE